ncbi:MAG: hypothetical protein V8R40_01615 [Dysosmobacter sp.]
MGTLESLWDANMDMLSPGPAWTCWTRSWPIYARSVNAPPAFLGPVPGCPTAPSTAAARLRAWWKTPSSPRRQRWREGARVSYSVLLPGTVVEPGAVVEYAILGENCRIGAGLPGRRHAGECRTRGAWGLTVLAPGCQVAQGRQVAAAHAGSPR